MTVWVSPKRKMTGQQPASLPVSEDRTLVRHLLEAYHLKTLVLTLCNADCRHWTRENLSRWLAGISSRQALLTAEIEALRRMLPSPPAHHPNYAFRFIDLFAGIGGIRKGFDDIGGQCVFTSEWNKHAVRTYKANWYCDPHRHILNQDIRSVTLSDQPQVSEQQACQYIDQQIPDHEVLLAGFPCQPFSLAGVSKKNSLGRTHGFECTAQGNLFFDIARIIAAKTPAIFVLENVKNVKSHDNGNTFAIIMRTLDELGYQVADAENAGHCDPKVIDAKHFLPQHRERIVLVCFRRDLKLHHGFTLRDIARFFPATRPELAQLLEKRVDDKYILSPKLWAYLYSYAKKHQQKGNGFGFGLVSPDRPRVTTRTLSARYYKDGSEILIDRDGNAASGESDFSHPKDQTLRPRRLTPREFARLMGFETPGDAPFIIPVSDTQAYRQFGNSVAVPVFTAVAKLLKPVILKAVSLTADPRTSDKNG